jgi:diguanylate cyclase (GGDEF)-like protein
MERQRRVLILDADGSIQGAAENVFKTYSLSTSLYSDISDLDDRIKNSQPQALLISGSLSSDPPATLFKQITAIDASLPVIVVTESSGRKKVAEFLKDGAHAVVKKPFTGEELYFVVNSAINQYMEKQKVQTVVQEVDRRNEYYRMSLLELEFVKSLHHVIGETEDPVSIFKTSYIMMRNSLAFEIFAAVVPVDDEIEILIYPNGRLNKAVAEYILGTLIIKMASASSANGDKHVKVMLNGQVEDVEGQPENYKSFIIPLASREQVHGFLGLYRTEPFDEYEESVVRRFCSHISFTLEKVGLFKEVKALSTLDGLTGVYNHRSIVGKLEEEGMRSTRYGSSLSLILFDIDNFKSINDEYGHLAGDAILKELAQVFKRGLRSIDAVGRYGGEEFLIILPETEGEGASIIGERLRKKISDESFSYNDRKIKVTVSGGVAGFRQGMDTNKLIKIADDNLLKAKREGKNMLCYDQAR